MGQFDKLTLSTCLAKSRLQVAFVPTLLPSSFLRVLIVKSWIWFRNIKDEALEEGRVNI